jgi:hypothetical protein
LQTPQYELTLADARIKAKSGKTSEALQALETMLRSARKFGYRLYEYQARLAIGEIELGSGAAAGRIHLTSLQKDARDNGAWLVANEAQALLASEPAKK